MRGILDPSKISMFQENLIYFILMLRIFLKHEYIFEGHDIGGPYFSSHIFWALPKNLPGGLKFLIHKNSHKKYRVFIQMKGVYKWRRYTTV